MESLNVSVTREEVQRFLSVKTNIGYGCGSGKGTDYGSGYRCGDGSGDGRGCGSGYSHYDGFGYIYGYGSNYGSGSGSGSGSNYGSGSGSGSGSGYGSGSGSGYGEGIGIGSGNCDESGEGSGISVIDIKTFKGYIIDYIDGVPTIITHIHNNVASGFIIGFDMTLIPCYVAKAGNYFAHGKTLKDAVKDAEAKEMGEMLIEERIEKFIEVFGSMDSEHTGKEFYDWHHILTGSCRMGRDAFCKENGIDLTKKYSVKYFLNITKNSYGGDIIKQIINELTKE